MVYFQRFLTIFLALLLPVWLFVAFFSVYVTNLPGFDYNFFTNWNIPIHLERWDVTKYYFGFTSSYNFVNDMTSFSQSITKTLQELLVTFMDTLTLGLTRFALQLNDTIVNFDLKNLGGNIFELFFDFVLIFILPFRTIVNLVYIVVDAVKLLNDALVLFFNLIAGNYNMPLPEFINPSIPSIEDTWGNIFNVLVSVTPLHR